MIKSRVLKKMMGWFALVGMGSTCFQLGSCDAAVRGQILGGLSSATTSLSAALIAAAFMALEDPGSGDLTGGLTTSSGI